MTRFEKIVSLTGQSIITSAFLIDASQERLSLLFPILILLLLLLTSLGILTNQFKFYLTIQSTLFLLFLFYISINSNIYCCSQESFKKVIRFGIGAVLFSTFSNISIKSLIPKAILIYSLLHIPSALSSIVGFLRPDVWLAFWSSLLTNSLTLFETFEISRGRISPIVPLDITGIIPIALLFSRKRIYRYIGSLSLFAAITSILMWNYRGYFLTLFFSVFILHWYIYKRKIGKSVIKISVITITSGLVIYLLSSIIFTKLNIFDRFALTHDIDKETIASRSLLFSQALELFRSSPIIGIGIANFETYSTPVNLNLTTPTGQRLPQFLMSYIPGPHNIFLEYLSETGLIGLSIFTGLLTSFLLNDIKIIKINASSLITNINIVVLIIASWMFIAGALFNSYSRAAFYTFCILRGLIANKKQAMFQ